jgi:hypothetical protein
VLVTTGSVPPQSREPSSRSEAVTELASASQFPGPPLAQPAQVSGASEAAVIGAHSDSPATSTSGAAVGSDASDSEASRHAPHASQPPTPSARAAEDNSDSLVDAAGPLGHDDLAPALTVQQFGTTTHSSTPPAQRSSSAGMLWGVAGVALGVGAIIGFFVVSRGESSDADFGPSTRVTAVSDIQAPPRRTDSPELNASSDTGGTTPAGSASALPSASASGLALDAGPDGSASRDEDADFDEEESRDAGPDAWVKPDWARPEDEEELNPLPPVAPSSTATGAKANPY